MWLALEQGLIEGPRLFYPGRALSQTGGHGDMRPGDQIEASACSCGYMGSLTVTADGPDEVRNPGRETMLAAMETCARHGVKLGLGSDLLGHEYMKLQGREFAYRGEVHPPLEVLRSATSINAAILREEGNLGCIAPSAHADLLVLEGDPMKDLSLFGDTGNIPIIMKAGEFVRRTGL